MRVEEWGLVDYSVAWEKQISYRDQLLAQGRPETLIVCSHPPVVTLGKSALKTDLWGWDGASFKIERGGKATFHGPGQILIYPILDLSLRHFDVHKLLRQLEQAVVNVLGLYGIIAQGNPDGSKNTTGVWVQKYKIASIGLAIKKWASYHGMAVNFQRGPNDFQGIDPCGHASHTMVYINEVLSPVPDRQEFLQHLISQLQLQLEL